MIELQKNELALINGGNYGISDISNLAYSIDRYFFNNYNVETQLDQIYSCIRSIAASNKYTVSGLTLLKKEMLKLENAFIVTLDSFVGLISNKLAGN